METPLEREWREVEEAFAELRQRFEDCRRDGATPEEVKRFTLALERAKLELPDLAPYSENC